jgi:ABC-2 type transport system permease protein
MRRILTIAKNDILIFLKDKRAVFFTVMTPIILTFLMGKVFTSIRGEDALVDLILIDHDQAEMGVVVTGTLALSPNLVLDVTQTEAKAKELVEGGAKPAYLVIPEGFTEKINKGEHAAISLFLSPKQDIEILLVKETVERIMDRIMTIGIATKVCVDHVTQIKKGVDVQKLVLSARSEAMGLVIDPLIKTEVITLGKKNKINTFLQYVPGYAVMFVLFAVMLGAESLLEEKETGTLKRLLICPINKMILVGGKVLGRYAIIVFQMVFLFLIGYIFFGTGFGQTVSGFFALVLLILLSCFAAIGLGMFLIIFVKTRKQIDALFPVIILPMSALGGAWWPLFLMPHWLQTVSKVTFVYWAMEGFNKVMIFGGGLSAVLINLAVLLLFGLCFLNLGLYFSKFRSE